MILKTTRCCSLAFLILLISLVSVAQKNTGTFHMSGAIRVEKGDATGAVVTLTNLKTKKVEDSITVALGGRFDLYLNYFAEYTMKVTKEDHYTKLIDVSTMVPSQVWAKDSVFPPFVMVVLLYRKIPKVTLSFEGKTVGKLCYSPTGKLDNFDSKIFISDKDIRKELDQAIQAQEDEIFNKLLAVAAEYEKKNMIREAIQTYQEALELRKNDSFVKPKLKELAAEMKNLEKDALLEADFRRLLQTGDDNVGKLKYAEAIDNYKGALIIRPSDKMATEKLAKAQQLLDKQNGEKAKLDAEFDRLLAVGNENINKQMFPEAIESIRGALKIKPDNSVAMARLAYAEQLLAKFIADKAQLDVRFNSMLATGDENIVQQRFEEAIGNFNAALKLKPGNKDATTKLAYAEQLLNKDRSAKAKLEADFRRLIASGDSAVSVKKYPEAIWSFKGALQLKASDPIATAKLNNAEQLLAKVNADKTRLEEEFNRLLASGDENVSTKKYQEAIGNFKAALILKAGDKIATAKLSNVQELVARLNADREKQEAEFIRLLAAGDENVTNLKYTEGIANFKDALTIKPEDAVALRKLKSAELLLARVNADKARQDEEFNRLLTTGDDNVSKQKYTEAIVNFKGALGIRVGDTLATSKLANAEQLLANVVAEKARQDAEFDRLLAAGDLEVTNQKYAEGIVKFKDALKIRPGNAIAVRKISDAEQFIAKLNAEKAKQDAEFLRLLAAGDGNVSKQKYPEAIESFKSALVIKAGDKLAASKLANAEQLLAKMLADKAKQDEDFNRLLTAGDKEVTNQKYPEGILLFRDALKIKPDNATATAKIKAAEQLLAKMKLERDKLEEDYNRLMAAGGANIFAQKYTDAIANFKSALEIMPGDQNAKAKLANAEQLLARQIAEKEKQEADYIHYLANGDAKVTEQKYLEAITSYKEALKVKIGDQVATAKIRDAEKLLAQAIAEKQKKEAELKLLADKEKRYKETISRADKLFFSKSLSDARYQYQEAIKISDVEKYPSDQIVAIDSLLAQQVRERLLAQKKVEEERKLQDEGTYLKNIQTGDANFAKSLWTIAIFYYQEALKYRPADKYALEKIENCNKMIDSNITLERLQEFKASLKQADDDLQAKKYSSARFYYGKAAGILPWENYPKEQLAVVEKLISSTDVNGTEAQYFDAVKKADDAMAQKNYAVARFYFQKASSLKPGEEYPKQQLKRISSGL